MRSASRMKATYFCYVPGPADVQQESGCGGCDKATRRANHFGFSEIVSSPGIKNILLFLTGKSPLLIRPSRPGKRGVGHRHERWGGLRWTRQRRARLRSQGGESRERLIRAG